MDGPWSALARPWEPGLVEMRRMLREVKVMRHLQHENIVRLLDVLPLRPSGGDLYLVMECMYKDLHRVIVSRQRLDPDHVQFFAYQILRALKYLHSARVVHRDIKPANLFVNQNCQLKLGDFGLARQIGAPAALPRDGPPRPALADVPGPG